MGVYGDYLGQNLASNFAALTAERKAQLGRISQIRERGGMVKVKNEVEIDFQILLRPA